jgi:hypothetical protein
MRLCLVSGEQVARSSVGGARLRVAWNVLHKADSAGPRHFGPVPVDLRARELITAMAEQGLWTSPAGKTPHATLYAAIHREIAAKGKDVRFVKAGRGLFASNPRAHDQSATRA